MLFKLCALFKTCKILAGCTVIEQRNLILCIEVDGRVVSCDGVWRALDQAGRLGVIPLRRESQIFGMTLTRRDRNLLARSALASIRAEKLDRNAGIMTVADFQRAVVEA